MPELIRDRYEVLAVLGRGGTTEVVRARDVQHDRPVALKVRRVDDDGDRALLLREGHALLGLAAHPHLPTVRDDFFLDDRYVLVMDWVEGVTLREQLDAQGDPGLPLADVLGWAAGVAAALDHLHDHDPPVVHGDVRADNVVIDAAGAAALVFGIRPLGGATATPATDVAAFAEVVVEALTGTRPADGAPVEWPGLDAELARRLGRVVRRARAADASLRASAVAELLSAARTVTLPTGVVTFVLTDIEGSTALWEAHPETMAEAVARHTDLAADIAERNHGVLPRSQGEGDSTLSAFARASDAVAAAAELEAAIATEPWRDDIALRVRIGVHTGEAQVRDGDYFGAAVSRTARLRSLARGGQVLLSQATAELVADHLPSGASLTDLGRYELRGLARPEEVWELRPDEATAVPGDRGIADPKGADAVRARPAFPSSLLDAPTAFVGRDDELGTLHAVWARVLEERRGRVVLLAGDPGIGKSRLSAEIAKRLDAVGAIVLAGRCYEENLVPYQPFVEAIGRYLRTGVAADVRRELLHSGAALTRLVPDVAMRFPDLPSPISAEPDTERYLMFEAVQSLLADLAARSPVVLLLDDLHWADRPTLALLHHVARNLEGGPVLVLGTFRIGEVVGDHPMVATIAELRRGGVLDEIALTGLADDAVRDLIADLARGVPDADFVRSAQRETDGNPFFIQEIWSHVADIGVTGGFTLDGLGVPDGVKQVIGRRIARLDETAGRLLGAASVIGREFDLDLVVAMTGVDEAAALDLLDAACDARVVEEVSGTIGRYSFVHALIRESLYDSLSATRRARLHRQVATAIETLRADTLDDELAALALHYAAAGTEPDKAVEYARRAGDEALARLAHEEAVVQYERGLALLDEQTTARCDLLLGLGEARRRSGLPGARDAFFEAGEVARSLGDAERLARAAIGTYRGHVLARAGWHDPVVGQLEAALDLLPPDDSALRSLVLATLGLELYFVSAQDPDPTRSRAHGAELSDQAVAMARRLGDEETLAFVLACRHTAIFDPDHLEDRLATATELIEVCRRIGHPELELIGHGHRACDLLEMARVDEARVEADLGDALASTLRLPMQRYFVLALHATLALLNGRFDVADKYALEGFEIALAAAHPDAVIVYGTHSAVMGWQRGETRHLVEGARQLYDEFVDLPAWHAAVALVLAVAGERDFPRDELLGFAADPDQLDKNSIWVAALVAWVEVARMVDEPAPARLIYDMLLPHADTICVGSINVSEMGPVARALGVAATLAGDHDAAEPHFRAALETSRRIDAPPHLARSAVDYARMLVERAGPGDSTLATELLDEGRAIAADLGMAGVVADADTLRARI
jgi:class 3 adenylate cyclase